MTPRFNQAIQEYYESVRPGFFTCAESGVQFEITKEMYEKYKELQIPLPEVAPHIRFRRLRAHMGGIELFKRVSVDAEPVISMYDPKSPALIIEPGTWRSDRFDAMRYGKSIDPDQPFFTQWTAFSTSVPRPAIFSDPDSENCGWCLYDLSFKNSYATFGGVECKNVLYADMCIKTANSVDVATLVESEWSYESVNCFQCSRTFFSEYCSSCLDVYFSFGCNNCTYCFGCVNLQNKKYCIFNVQYSKEEYQQIIAKIDLSDRNVLAEVKKNVETFWRERYYPAAQNYTSENCVGDEVVSSVDSHGISLFEAARLYNGYDASFIKDSCDIATCSSLERSVHSVCCTDGYENKMNISCHNCISVEYSEMCTSCEYCFGCIGLKNKKFCIFNVQYSEEDYWRKIDEIKSQMLRRREYGQFFPYQTSLIAYNVSHADVFFSLTKEEVLNLGARWFDIANMDTQPGESIDALPQKVAEADESILTKRYICKETGRPFSIVKPELAFHDKMELALPETHPSYRRKQRYEKMQGLRLFEHACSRCNTSIQTRIDPAKKFNILCAECFSHTLVEDEMMYARRYTPSI